MSTPWYTRAATTGGRPAVLAATLVMSMPGEYHVARFAGWTDPWAYGMPFSLSAYAGIAAVVAAARPKGARGRFSAVVGAGLAILLALAAQVVAHLVGTGHMNGDQAWLIAITSMVPPAVLAHLLHLAATPTVTTGDAPVDVPVDAAPAPAVTPAPAQETPAIAALSTPAALPPLPAWNPTTPVPAQPAYGDPRHEAIRRLYDHGTRPGTKQMQAAILAATGTTPSPSGARTLRQTVEAMEPHLARYPAAINGAA